MNEHTPQEREPLRFPPAGEAVPPSERFRDLCAENHIELEAGEIDRLGRYLALLIAANSVVNLTRIDDPAEAWERHVFDALTLLPVLSEITPGEGQLRIVDVGSGGGSPGIPLACVLPEARVTLVESVGKKAAFLTHAADALGLSNLTVCNVRAERIARDRSEHRERHDASVCRALARLPLAAELTCPLVRPGGLSVFIKGAQAEAELAEAGPLLELLRAAPAGVVPTPTGRVVVLEKIGRAPRRFPRRGRSLGQLPQ